MTIKLTAKQEKFAQAFVEIRDATKAYRIAYSAEKMSKEALWIQANRIKATTKVAARIAELQRGHQKRHNITIDNLTDKLLEIYKIAMSPDKKDDDDCKHHLREVNLNCAYLAVMGLAKLHGLDKLRIEHSGPGGSSLLLPVINIRFTKPHKKEDT